MGQDQVVLVCYLSLFESCFQDQFYVYVPQDHHQIKMADKEQSSQNKVSINLPPIDVSLNLLRTIAMTGITIISTSTAYAWLKMKIAKKKKKQNNDKIVDQSQSDDVSEITRSSQIHQTSTSWESTTEKLNSRAVNFSMSQTRVVHFDAEIQCHSLVWYKAADLQQFKEEAMIDASRIKNKVKSQNDEEIICWWGLERLIVPLARSKTRQVKEQVKQVVLCKQDKCHQDRQLKEASGWAAMVAQKKAAYYSSHL